ncbi:MAG: hypothetical protein H0T47_04520 [Planctomycetaceae bacterium]|nr:hypothetical protein [Planctomycetaceae bacterium]
MSGIQRVLNRQFGGHTPIGETNSPPGVTSGGQWVDPDTGETVIDVCWMVKVAVDPDKLPLFRRIVKAIGFGLEQTAMYTEIGPPTVEILDVDGAEPPDKEQQSLFDEFKRLLDNEDQDGNSQAATG